MFTFSDKTQIGSYSPFHTGTAYTADGKLFVFGNTGSADNAPHTLLVQTEDLSTWTEAVAGTTINFRAPDSGKIHLPDGRSGYWGWYCYRDDNVNLLGENALYYSFQETHAPTVDNALFRRVAPTLSNGGDYYFAAGRAATPIVRGNYVYWVSWCDKTQAIRTGGGTNDPINNATTGNCIRVWRALVADIGNADAFQTYVDLPAITNCYQSEPDWAEITHADGSTEIILLIRVESSTTAGLKKGIFISRSTDFLDWSAPTFFCNGFPAKIYQDHDGTVYVASAERGPDYGGNRWDTTAGSRQQFYVLASTDYGDTFSLQVVGGMDVATSGYAYLLRFKSQLIYGFYDVTPAEESVDDVQYLRTISDHAMEAPVLSLSGLQYTAVVGGHDVTSKGVWYSSDNSVAIVYNGAVTPVSSGTVTITFDYAGYLVNDTMTITVDGTSRRPLTGKSGGKIHGKGGGRVSGKPA